MFDSGDALEQITAARNADVLQRHTHEQRESSAIPNDWTHDNRSDDKGPEPENVTVAKLFGRDFAFIVLERIGGVMIYELSDPKAPRFVDYVNTRVFGTRREHRCRRGPRPRGRHRDQGRRQSNGQAAARGRQRSQRDDADSRD